MRPAPRLALCLAAALALTVGACGSNRGVVDTAGRPPFVNALDVDPATGALLLTTNLGFFRIDPATGKATEIHAGVSSAGRSSAVGRFLDVLSAGRGRLLGSGHPDIPGALPPFLGLIQSRDGGQTWSVVSGLGRSDLHKLVAAHGLLYGWDAVGRALVVSRDGGRTFVARRTPPGVVIDFAVSPANAGEIVASTGVGLIRTTDQGHTWTTLRAARGARLAWPAARMLVRADAGGGVWRSHDGGRSWLRAGRLPGEPYKLKDLSATRLYAALADGTIERTADGGRTWRVVFAP